MGEKMEEKKRYAVKYAEDMGEEVMEVLYPEDFDMQAEFEKNAYRNLDPATLEIISSMWEELKISGGMPTHVYIVAAVLAVVIAAALTVMAVRSRKRSKWW